MDEIDKFVVYTLGIVIPFAILTYLINSAIIGLVGILLMTGLISIQIDILAIKTRDRLKIIMKEDVK